MNKKIKKIRGRVTSLVPTRVSEKAAELNPLTPLQPQVPSLDDVPQITNETIAEHREEVLKGARKYIYPLRHSKHRIVVVTSAILASASLSFLIYCGFGLYRYYQYNTFLYRVTQVAPFPIAKVGGSFVSYENYLFQVRHYVHYYQDQLNRNFAGDEKQQLLEFRRQALGNVIDTAYIKKLASANHVNVSDKEVNSRILEVRNQNRLGSNNKVFTDVLHDYWGWSINDFKRSLKEQILSEKVVAKLDTATAARANVALAQLWSGADFATVAKQFSDDPGVAASGGDYGIAITRSNPNVPPQVIDQLFNISPGQVSGVINAGTSLQIVKLNQKTGDTLTASRIVFNLKDISTYLGPLKAKQPAHTYVKF